MLPMKRRKERVFDLVSSHFAVLNSVQELVKAVESCVERRRCNMGFIASQTCNCLFVVLDGPTYTHLVFSFRVFLDVYGGLSFRVF